MTLEDPVLAGCAARFAGFEFDLATGELRMEGGAVVSLGEKPFRILRALIERPGELVTREVLRELLWPNGTIVEFEHSINAAVNRLRQVLGDSAENPRYIETLARRGYRWLVPVEWRPGPLRGARAMSPAGATAATGSAPALGSRLAHYRLLEVIGGGGMGVVYRAEDLKLGRSVALKFLGEEFAGDARAIKRFEREARTISALEHPNICTIYGVEEYEGHPVIVMQWLQGETLRERIENGPGAFAPEALTRIVLAILDALEVAHERHIIHRDVKPANVFITGRGVVKLLDFGLATLSDTRAEPDDGAAPARTGATTMHALTQTGATMGTASYMAPEQVSGDPVDARTDLFSLGVVLYEMATGQRPFQGATRETLADAILHVTPAAPATLNPAIPASLAAVIERALQKSPAQRYSSAQEMRAALLATVPGIAGAGPAPVRQASPRLPLARRTARRRWRMAAGVAVAALVTALIIGQRLLDVPRGAAGRPQIEKVTDSGRVSNVAISRDARYVAYTQREAAGDGVWVRTLGTREETLLWAAADGAHYSGLSFSPSGESIYAVRADEHDPGFKSLYVLARTGGPAHLVLQDIDSPVSFAPDGLRFAFTRGIPVRSVVEVHIARADGHSDQLLTSIPGVFAGYQPGATWSPDGRLLTVPLRRFGNSAPFAVYTVHTDDGRVGELLQGSTPIGRALWVPGGDRIIVPIEDMQGRRQLWLASYPKGERRPLSNDLVNYGDRPDLSADGNSLAALAGSWIGNLWAVPRSASTEPQQLTSLSLGLVSVAELPDGQLLSNSPPALWRFSGDATRHVPLDESGTLDTVTVCGRYLVADVVRGGVTDIVRLDADGTHALRLATGDYWLPACGRSGRYVYFIEYSAPGGIWRVDIGGGPVSRVGRALGDGIVGRLNVTNDEAALIYPYEQYAPQPAVKLAIVPVSGAAPAREIDLPGGVYGLGSPLLSPEGTSIAYVVTRGSVSNVWEQPLAGGAARQLTNFPSGRIVDISWSRDGTRLLLCRGELTRDAVLLRNLRAWR